MRRSNNGGTALAGAVMVIGGGIGGIQASLDLADSGYKVYLVESKPSIGGVMPQLDKTFPTNDCSMCILAPKLMDCGRHANIEIITLADIDKVSGEAGNFTISILQRPRYVDEEKCNGCGLCTQKCPTKVPSEFDRGLASRKAIYIPFPQAVPNKPVIDSTNCLYFKTGKCKVCEKTCQAGAIRYKQESSYRTLHVGAIIMASGYDLYDAQSLVGLGYGMFRNVITSIEFERILSASGPYQGHIGRLSDRQEPHKIAFIQCVGSRNTSCNIEYCSSVCCTYAIKEAVIAKEHAKGGIEATLFYMDMRTFGKGFDAYYERAKDEYGVKFIRSRVSEIYEDPETKNLHIQYVDEGALKREDFDLVVLSVGFVPKDDAQALAETLGIELNSYNFCQTSEFLPVETTKKGVFVCGAFAGPKDIPDTVMQACGSAGKASALLAPVRNTLVAKKEYPEEEDTRESAPRIGVFICHCGINIGGYLNVPSVVEYAKTLKDVVYADDSIYACSPDAQRMIVEMIKAHELNRIIVASCTPRTHEPLFRETLKEAGLNPHLFEMANIREQCSWIHMDDPDEATRKAKDLVRMAIAKAQFLESLPVISIEVVQKGLVIGGGLAGMTAALEMAKQGFEVYLIEKEAELGGVAKDLHCTLEGHDIQELLRSMIEKVEDSQLIHVFKNVRIEHIEGFVGNYTTTFITHISPPSALNKNDNEHGQSAGAGEQASEVREIKHGIIIVAIGAKESNPTEYLYGENEKVITQLEFE